MGQPHGRRAGGDRLRRAGARLQFSGSVTVCARCRVQKHSSIQRHTQADGCVVRRGGASRVRSGTRCGTGLRHARWRNDQKQGRKRRCAARLRRIKFRNGNKESLRSEKQLRRAFQAAKGEEKICLRPQMPATRGAVAGHLGRSISSKSGRDRRGLAGAGSTNDWAATSNPRPTDDTPTACTHTTASQGSSVPASEESWSTACAACIREMQILCNHVRLKQGGLQCNPHNEYQVKRAFHPAIMHDR